MFILKKKLKNNIYKHLFNTNIYVLYENSNKKNTV